MHYRVFAIVIVVAVVLVYIRIARKEEQEGRAPQNSLLHRGGRAICHLVVVPHALAARLQQQCQRLDLVTGGRLAVAEEEVPATRLRKKAGREVHTHRDARSIICWFSRHVLMVVVLLPVLPVLPVLLVLVVLVVIQVKTKQESMRPSRVR